MKKVLALVLICYSGLVFATQRAVTDTGDIVILRDNGTWEFASKNQTSDSKIETDHTKYKKPASSKFLLKSKRNSAEVWLNQKIWSFKRAQANSPSEYQFRLNGQDLYGMLLAERTEMPVKTLAIAAIENAKKAATNVRIFKKEYRYVNGHKVLFMNFSGNIQGADFTYYGYYYSDKTGSTQFLTYCASNLASTYKKNIFKFLNGLDRK